MADDLAKRGLALRKQVMGSEAVERQVASADRYAQLIETFENEMVWGTVWSRSGLDTRTRLMLNLAMMTALNRPEEMSRQLRAALANGLSREDIVEVLLHANAYCGGPAGVEAFRLAREAFAELGPAQGAA